MSEDLVKHEWIYTGDGRYSCVKQITPVDKVPTGFYTIDEDDDYNLELEKIQLREDDVILDKDNKALSFILKESQIFWNSEDFYKQSKIAYKRGYILYGKPGTGKSVFLRRMATLLLEQYQNCLVINSNNEPGFVSQLIEHMVKTNDLRKLIVIFDDLDKLISKYGDGPYLELLDGILESPKGILWIGATNYIDKIPDRIKNRPSRFDRIVSFDFLSQQARVEFIKKLNPSASQKDVDKIVNASENMTFAELKELVLAFFLYGEEIESIKKRLGENNENE